MIVTHELSKSKPKSSATKLRKLHGWGLVKAGKTKQAKELLKSTFLLVEKEAKTKYCFVFGLR
jgi:hypothetical protein